MDQYYGVSNPYKKDRIIKKKKNPQMENIEMRILIATLHFTLQK